MAKLRSYYGLCPLIDHSSFLGVSEDLKQGCVNVTLGKNIVIKYKLSDQKQISSWSTKDGLTSAVVYDKIGKRYAAAFAQNQLRVWEYQEVNLDKVRKRKFQLPIHTIIPQTKGEPIVIFKNGTCCSLSYALENRKTVRAAVLKDNETIQDQVIITANNQTFVSYIVQSGLNRSCLVMEVTNDNYVELPTDVKMRIIVRKDAKVRCIGSTFVLNEGLSQLLTIWSDGRLYSMSLFSNESEQSPGVFLSAISVLSPKTAIVMSPLSSNYIAMYGADSNQEGASIIIYNLQFKIVQSSQRFKLFGKNAKLIIIGSSILLAAGQSIAVIPFNLETEQLATIVGSQKTNDLIEDDIKIISEMEVVSWDAHKPGTMTNGVSHDIIPKDTPNSIKPLLKEMSSEGLAEGLIAEQIIPFVLNLKCINTLTWCIAYFRDFPDHLLLKVLHFGLTVDDAVFPQKSDYETESPLKPSGRRDFINKVLNISFSDVTLLPCLRKHLSFTDTITLLHHLKFLLIDNCNDCVGELIIVEWISILLDAHYQEYLLVHDESIVELLHDLRKVVCDSIVCLRDIKPLLAFLTRLQEGKNVAAGPNYEASKWYSIEQIKLY